MISRRGLLAGLIAGAAGPVLAEAPLTSPRPPGRPAAGAVPAGRRAAGGALVEAAELAGQVGYLAVDVETGALVEARQPDDGLPPASTAKILTALYAMDRLGPSFRFATRLIATGPIEGGTVRGDLVLAGSGDPTLSTDGLARMAADLRARGVTGVSGRFLVWDAALPSLGLIDREQPEQAGYNPAISGLNLNFNRVHFEWRRGGDGWNVAMDARSDTLVPEVAMARMRVVARDAPLFTFDGQGGTDNWTVASSALGNGGSRWLPVRQPALYAGDVFRTLAAGRGTRLPAAETVGTLPGGTVLVEGPSEPLPVVVKDMLKFSTNLTAEVLGLTASGPGTATLAASGGRMGAWAVARFGRAGRFVDHSGLGDDSRVAPADMVAALTGATAGPLRGLMKPFAIRDARGREIKGHPVKVLAKTGTLNFVSGLAGYATMPGGRVVAFAIHAADIPRRDAVPPADREQPPGSVGWAKRARVLQSRLIEHWAGLGG